MIDGAHEGDQLVVDDFDHELIGLEGFDDLLADGFFFDDVAEFGGDFDVDVGFEEGGSDGAHGLGDVFFADLSASAEVAEDFAESFC